MSDSLTNIEVNRKLAAIKEEMNRDQESDKGINIKNAIDNLHNISTMVRGPWRYMGSSSTEEEKKKDQAWIKEMTKLGEQHGNKPVPAPDSTAEAPTGEEKDVIASYTEWYAWYAGMVKDVRELINTLLDVLGGEIKRYANVCEGSKNNYFSEQISKATEDRNLEKIQKLKDPLSGDRGPEQTFRTNLNTFSKFREEQGLDRYPSYSSPPAIWIAIILVIVIESGINTWFYATASDGGLLGGLTTAAGASVMICLCGYFMGYFFRYKNLKGDKNLTSSRDKYFFFLTPFCVLGALITITFLCIYRDTAVTAVNIDTVLIDSVNRFLSLDIIPTGSVETIGLFIMNSLCVFASYYKGYFSRDKLPGYVAAAEQMAKARETYTRAIESEKAKLKVGEKYKNKFKDTLEVPSENYIRALISRYKEGVSICEQLGPGAKVEVKILADGCRKKLEAYRHANKKARPHAGRDNPPPAYFDEYPSFEYVKLDAYKAVPVDDIDIYMVREILAEHRKKAIDEIQDLYNDIMIDKLESHMMESTAYMYEINEADEYEDEEEEEEEK